MKDHSLAVDPTLTIEYQKLFTAASKYREVWTYFYLHCHQQTA